MRMFISLSLKNGCPCHGCPGSEILAMGQAGRSRRKKEKATAKPPKPPKRHQQRSFKGGNIRTWRPHAICHSSLHRSWVKDKDRYENTYSYKSWQYSYNNTRLEISSQNEGDIEIKSAVIILTFKITSTVSGTSFTTLADCTHGNTLISLGNDWWFKHHPASAANCLWTRLFAYYSHVASVFSPGPVWLLTSKMKFTPLLFEFEYPRS